MTMVNTFMKTQHQHVMPQRKERKTLKANPRADPGRRLRAGGRARAGRGSPWHRTPLPVSAFLPAQPPVAAPRPRGRQTTTPEREAMECVKTLAGGPSSLRGPPPPHPREKSHASVIPAAYVHLGQRTCSHEVENRDDKTWLENDRRARPRWGHARTETRSSDARADAAHQGQYGIIIYSKNGHVPRLDLLFFLLLSFTVE